VLLVLLGGQVLGSWQRRPPAEVTNVGGVRQPATVPRPAAPVANPGTTVPPAAPTAPTSKPTRKPAREPTRSSALAAMGVQQTTGNGGVALTFDDGPHPRYTPQVLALLRAHRVKALFCLVGTEVRRYPRLVAQIVREGHTLCNHTWHHELKLGSKSAAKISANLAATSAEIRRAVPGAKIPYFRQPGGLWTPALARVARGQGMTPLDWSVDPADWANPPARLITSRVLSRTRAGSVVLLHDAGGDRAGTVTACRKLIPALMSRFRLIPLR
jgi:peptidoglycan/xylan/chitin deacetylase (PgdA/CDA1 family)